MPLYRNDGQAPVKYGTATIEPGDTVDASALPSKNFTLVEPDPPKSARRTRSAAAADPVPAATE